MKKIYQTSLGTLCIGLLLSFSSPKPAPAPTTTSYNPQCTAIAKSTGKQCKNRQYGKCAYVLCYVHCK
ncbi:hypothetical protein [Rufibacter sp. LB8]|uniref:hypothetical protein n=1 Tax=Rufibacter sp. LB8 TaxID=2777781 RepID=UPI00178C5516|nr:hypothetical protein [Rufibacter sp. LB8]